MNDSVVLASETVASDVGDDAACSQRGAHRAALGARRALAAVAILAASTISLARSRRAAARALALLALPRLLALYHAVPRRAVVLLS